MSLPKPYYSGNFVDIYHADCLSLMQAMESDSFDAVITDPPYGLTQNKKGGSGEKSLNLNSPAGRSRITTGFMGMKWDHGVPGVEYWAEAMRVAKPGAHLLAFGGTRTYHRLACMIEDSGWEIRDCIMWVYGSGFPKSHNLDGDWAGWGTALKPAWEPILIGRKPLIGTVAENVISHRTGAMNIEASRVGDEPRINTQSSPTSASRKSRVVAGYRHDAGTGPGHPGGQVQGRWPSNLIHDGSEDVLACFLDAPGQLADASTNAEARKTQHVYGRMARGNGRDSEASADSKNDGVVGFNMKPGARRDDHGSAARFFYCAKASRDDRDSGMDAGNHHPTVKPTALMRYLCRLVTPPDGLIFDPFMGSGSTGVAARHEGFRFIGVDQDISYCAIAEKRLAQQVLAL